MHTSGRPRPERGPIGARGRGDPTGKQELPAPPARSAPIGPDSGRSSHREGAQLTCDALGLTLGPVLKLYYYPGNASFTPHVLLNEIGAPFELALVDRSVDAHRARRAQTRAEECDG